jgi:hypothetical protein
MSPQVLAMLQRIDRDTRRLAGGRDECGAVWPRDYFRPLELVRIWHGPGARYFPHTSTR